MISNISIRAKFLLAQVFLTALVAIFIYTYYPSQQKEVSYKAIMSEFQHLSNLFTIGVGIGMGETDIVAVSEVLNWASKDSSVLYIRVTNTLNQEIISFNPEGIELPDKVQNADEQQMNIESGNKIYYKSTIDYQNEHYGALTIVYSLDQLHKDIAALQLTTLYFCIGLFLTSTFIAIIITNMITGDIRKLDNTVKSISEGNEHIRMDIKSNDEIGKLGKAFNNMLDRLEKSHRELKSYSEQLKKQNEELNQFSYVVSHDLKAPLRAIYKLSEWIEEDLEEVLTEDARSNIQILRSRVFRLESLINGLLEYAKIGRTNISTEKTDVNKLIKDVIDLLNPPAHFTINIQHDMPVFETKKIMLQQVFMKLISNAIKYNDKPQAFINITVEDHTHYYRFTIQDNGIGINSTYYDKIFTIFQTLEARDKIEGTGIGLSIVKKILLAIGGGITLDSKEGEGTTFEFTWPKVESIKPLIDYIN